jgi:hypothetical protein
MKMGHLHCRNVEVYVLLESNHAIWININRLLEFKKKFWYIMYLSTCSTGVYVSGTLDLHVVQWFYFEREKVCRFKCHRRLHCRIPVQVKNQSNQELMSALCEGTMNISWTSKRYIGTQSSALTRPYRHWIIKWSDWWEPRLMTSPTQKVKC